MANKLLFALVAVSFLLSGCASVVYKDSATKYSDSAAKLITKIHEAENLTAKASEAEKRERAAQDSSCPVAAKNVYLSKPVDTERTAVVAMLDRYPTIKGGGACRKLQACIADRSGVDCGRICLGPEEANCLDNLTHAWTAAAAAKVKAEEEAATKAKERGVVPDKDKKPEKESPDEPLANYREVIDSAKIGSNRLSAPRIVAESLQSFATYLDLLDEYADKDASKLKERSTKFATRIKERADLIKDFTGNEVLSSAEITAQQKYVQAFGKLASNLQDMARNYKDANQIKEIVGKNEAEVSRTLALLQDYAATVSNIGFVKTTSFTLNRRNAIQKAYSKENKAEERLKMFDLLDKLPYVTEAAGMDEIFEAFEKSHIALVRLIQNPNDEDLKLLRAQRFEEFKNIASDLASLAKLFI
jgi:DNA-binding protein H-NS